MAERGKNTGGKGRQKPVVVPDMGRLQPQARELEEAVLGALMLEKDAYSIVSENRHLHIILSSLYLINIVTPGPRGRLNAHQTPNMSSSVIIVAIAYGIQPAKNI